MTDGPSALPAPQYAQADALSVEGITHAFASIPVLHNVSFRVRDRGVTAIVGPSGCGKSTLFRVLAGLLVPDSGAAAVHGESVLGRTGAVAFMPQRDHLLPWRRVLDNAVLGARIRGVSNDVAREQAGALMATFGLAGHERSWPSELSGGMRQRLALLRTFLVGLDVLLLDEPFGALDAITRRSMHGWLQSVLADVPRAVLLITHDVEEAIMLADQIVVLSPRPARVLGTFDVQLGRPRSSAMSMSPAFVGLKAEVLSVLDGAHPENPPGVSDL